MVSLLLVTHISLAVVSLIYAGSVVVASSKRNVAQARSRTKIMWLGTGSTLLSGIVVALAAGASFGRTCASLFVFLVVVLAAQYYERRIAAKV